MLPNRPSDNPSVNGGERFLATRASLLGRLADWEDRVSWTRFFDLYWRLLFGVAVKAGLTESEAEEVVQETVLAVAKNIGRLGYDPARGSFKSWLLAIARTKVADQFRARPAQASAEWEPDAAGEPGALEALWDREWNNHLLQTSLALLKEETDPLQYQIFDCYVIKDWTPKKVAATLGVSTGQVYLAKNRLAPKLRAIVDRLERDGR